MRDKILVGTIFSDVKDYVIRDWYKNVCKFTHPGFDFCAVDNSADKKYHKEIFHSFVEDTKTSPVGKLTVLHNTVRHKRSEVFMAFSSNQLRQHFLLHDYDWLLYLEADVFPPLDILDRLLSFKKQIISALYFTGDKGNSRPVMGDIHHYLKASPHMYLKGPLQGFFDLGEATVPQRLVNGGLGCMLLYKDVVAKIPFRYDPEFRVHNDTMFAKDLWENDMESLYVPIMCSHENQTWDIQNKMIAAR